MARSPGIGVPMPGMGETHPEGGAVKHGEAERTKLARARGAQRRLHGLGARCLTGEAEREGCCAVLALAGRSWSHFTRARALAKVEMVSLHLAP
jgi:hypothetical protein